MLKELFPIQNTILKTLKENLGESLFDLGLDKDYLGMTPKTQSINGGKNVVNWTLSIKTSVLQRIPLRKR